MADPANHRRGEAAITIGDQHLLLRPSFSALVAAEEELGSLFDLVERAAAGHLRFSEIAVLFWHVISERPPTLTRDQLGAGLMQLGLSGVTPALKILLRQILQGVDGDPD